MLVQLYRTMFASQKRQRSPEIQQNETKRVITRTSPMGSALRSRFMLPYYYGKSTSLDKLRTGESDKVASGKKIHKFMRNTQTRRRQRHLGHVCSNSGACIAFGLESKKIRDFFDGYTTFTYAQKYFTRIGAESANGVVMELFHKNHGYEAATVIKSSREIASDNLYYEFVVGQFINKQVLRFPCFVETYGLFKYTSDAAYNSIVWPNIVRSKNRPNVNTIPWSRTELELVCDLSTAYSPQMLTMACQDSKYLALLSQYYHGAVTLHQLVTDKLAENDADFFYIDLPAIMYQVYAPLNSLILQYAHNDLHLHNVLIYIPNSQSAIEFEYHREDGTMCTFRTKYLAKIIDYGRSYFSEKIDPAFPKAKPLSTNAIALDTCRLPACNRQIDYRNQQCGNKVGFAFLKKYAVTDRPTLVDIDRVHKYIDGRLSTLLNNQLKTHMVAGIRPPPPSRIPDTITDIEHRLYTYFDTAFVAYSIPILGTVRVYLDPNALTPMQFIPTEAVAKSGRKLPVDFAHQQSKKTRRTPIHTSTSQLQFNFDDSIVKNTTPLDMSPTRTYVSTPTHTPFSP
jgi:hypothetical protein